jgi:ketosteroid isomerase-like protein
MSHQNVEIVRQGIALVNAADWDTLFGHYHSDVEFRDLQHAPDLPEVVRGLEGFRQLTANWTEVYDEFRAEVYEYVDAHPWVICDTRWYGNGRGSDMPIDIHVADAYELKDGKIARAVFSYPDVATALAAVGLTE